MAKIINPNINILPFASTATKRTIFGGIAGDISDLLVDNLNADYITGWEVLPVGENPYIQYFNALGYSLSTQLSLLFQEGVREWTALQEYHINGISKGSDGSLYRSLSNTNTGNDPTTDIVNWVAVGGGLDLASQAEAEAGIDNTKAMTALRTTQQVTDRLADNATAIAGVNTNSLMTPLETHNVVKEYAIGEGQAWQDVTASRNNNVEYTNTTGRSIAIAVRPSGNFVQKLLVDGFRIGEISATTGVDSVMFAIVPDGSTYELDGSVNAIIAWNELR